MSMLTDVSYADNYFALRIKHLVWDNATNDTKIRALSSATMSINRLNFAGCKTLTSQVLEFPRDGETSIPEAVQQACCEEAYSLADGRDPEQELSGSNQLSVTMEGVHLAADDARVPIHILHGMVSSVAWNLLRPYLLDPYMVILKRVS